jgi:phage/plasmid-associated DNA primase
VGRLANVCGDIGPQTAKDMSLFKQTVGGDRIQAERKLREPFEFISGATPIFSANEFPGSPDTTRAYKDRWVAIEWCVRFADYAAKGNELKALGENRGEMEGFLLQAALGGAHLWQASSEAMP